MQHIKVILTGLAVVGLISAPVSVTAKSGIPGDIVFTQRGDRQGLWRVYPGQTPQVVDLEAEDAQWSPDGRRLIFAKTNGLFIYNNGYQRQITQPKGFHDSSPMWSPDGSMVAFTRHVLGNDQQSAVYVKSVKDMHPETNISGWSAQSGYRLPSWAPDSQRVVYESYDSAGGALFIHNLQVKHTRFLTSIEAGTRAQPQWSPNGRKILYNDSPGQLYTIWPDGSRRAVISDGESYHGAWSPDGSQIVFLEGLTDDSISFSRADGTVEQLAINRQGYQQLGQPLWSPDGATVVFLLHGIATNPKASAMVMVKLSDGQQQPITTGAQLAGLHWQATSPQNNW